MRPKTLEITNFGPFGEKQRIDFTRYETSDHVLIVGNNKDTAGADSNGSGKTQAFNALSWLIFGYTPSGRPTDEIIREGTNFVKVVGFFEDRQKREIYIQRTRKRGNSPELLFSIDGDDTLTKRTTAETQLAILNYMGILENNKEYYNDFLNTTYFSIDALKAFAGKKSSSKDRMNLINRFLRGEVLDRAMSYCKTKISNLQGQKEVFEGKLEQIQERLQSDNDIKTLKGNISELRAQIIDAEAEVSNLEVKLESLNKRKEVVDSIDDVDMLIEQANSQFNDYKEQIEESIKDLEAQAEKLSSVRDEIEKIEEKLGKIDKSKLIEQSEKLSDKINEGEVILRDIKKEVTSIQNQIEEALSCPECNASLMFDGESIVSFDKAVLEKSVKEKKSKGKKIKDKVDELTPKLQKIDDKLETIKKYENKLKALKDRESDFYNIPEKIEQKRENLDRQKSKVDEQLKGLRKKRLQLELRLKKLPNVDIDLKPDIELSIETLQDKVKGYRDGISRNEYIIESVKRDLANKEKIEEQIEAINKEVEQYGFWRQGFPEIKRWMINSFLPSFEEQTNHFLSKLEVGMRVYFDTLKAKKSKQGEFKEEFDISIMDENNHKRDFETYSQGESKRIGICTGFALRELTLNKGYNAFDFLLIDEVVDSLDETGINEFFNLLNIISGLKLIISHDTTLKNRFTNVITFTKENGITTVKQT